ncbi:Protocadherin-17 Protocadherin-68 [Triplophysa tibetana]|uniref:Protocadherin-17 Protocadherin-68 n=1 Tax=Triplophysa tibetana TaxID=1572043 RepID=A0A5A9NC73_9TELE|nr:Protocadherin-17 Protocadherin-68 [Triplophysa tibetana]
MAVLGGIGLPCDRAGRLKFNRVRRQGSARTSARLKTSNNRNLCSAAVTFKRFPSNTDNFPAESNYMGNRQQFVQSSSTFKDPERASLRDSGHGDSDQADSDQDTNKGSCCDMSAKEALKMKASGLKPQPLEQGTFSVYQSRQPHYDFISQTTLAFPFSECWLDARSRFLKTLIMEHRKRLINRQATLHSPPD